MVEEQIAAENLEKMRKIFNDANLVPRAGITIDHVVSLPPTKHPFIETPPGTVAFIFRNVPLLPAEAKTLGLPPRNSDNPYRVDLVFPYDERELNNLKMLIQEGGDTESFIPRNEMYFFKIVTSVLGREQNDDAPGTEQMELLQNAVLDQPDKPITIIYGHGSSTPKVIGPDGNWDLLENFFLTLNPADSSAIIDGACNPHQVMHTLPISSTPYFGALGDVDIVSKGSVVIVNGQTREFPA